MTVNRRDAVKQMGGIAVSAALAGPSALEAAVQPSAAFPRKQDFGMGSGVAYINAAYTHPIPRVATDAVRRYLDARGELAMPPAGSGGGAARQPNPKALFAGLIGAEASEIAYVPNTSTGENLVVNSLGLDKPGAGNIVTDWLHFEGALMHLMALKERGVDVRVVKPTADFRIDMADMARLVDRNTRLISISSTATYNGFQHDLKAVADLAHANGALVYADIIHSAGAEPMNLKQAGVDFAACSTYKWLMGDYGIGFLYARGDLLERLQRTQVSYYQAATTAEHLPPFEMADTPVTWTFKRDTTGHFELGTIGGALLATLGASLTYLNTLGVDKIQAWRAPMIKKLRDEVPRFGFTIVTPASSTSGIITFAKRNVGTSDLPRRLQDAKVSARVSTHWIRLSPSVYNDMADIDRFLDVLK
jgi:selenocysteine lyase/cysteine desulfurase